jgi:hypothetical protein
MNARVIIFCLLQGEYNVVLQRACPVWGDWGAAKSAGARWPSMPSPHSTTNDDWTRVGASRPTLSRQPLEPSFLSIGLRLLV